MIIKYLDQDRQVHYLTNRNNPQHTTQVCRKMLLVRLLQESIKERIDGGGTQGQRMQTVVNVAVCSSPLVILAIVHLWHK